MLTAVLHIDSFGGGSQSHLLAANNGELYVVKFKNNSQALKVLFNDFLGSRIAQELALTVPDCEVIEVQQSLIDSTAHLRIHKAHGDELCAAGRQFASHYRGSIMPGRAIDYLPEGNFVDLKNLEQYAGMLAFDKWTCNTDGRQAIYVRTSQSKRYTAIFIDQGYCFNANQWCFVDIPLRGVFTRNFVYADVTGWHSFDPWLSAIETFDASVLWKIVEKVPPEWYNYNLQRVDALVEELLKRRSIVRDLIDAFRLSDRNPFPAWSTSMSFCIGKCVTAT